MTTDTATHVLDETAQRFLASLASHGLVTAAAAAAGVSPQAIYKRRAKDDHFAGAWNVALEQARERISAALQRSASDQDTAARMLGEVADRLRNPDLSPDDRGTLMRQLDAIAARIDELRQLANSEAARAHVRRRDEARDQLRKDAETAVAVAAEFDEAIKQLDPAWKRLLAALAAVQRTGVRAEVATADVNIDVMLRAGLHFHAPTFAAAINLLRPDRRHQLEFAKFVASRMPGVSS